MKELLHFLQNGGWILVLTVIIGILFLIILHKGKRDGKNMTLDELSYWIQVALLTDLNAQSLKKSIDEMRERFIYERKDHKADSREWLTATCNLKRLEEIEKMFQYKFVEFLPGAKVEYSEIK